MATHNSRRDALCALWSSFPGAEGESQYARQMHNVVMYLHVDGCYMPMVGGATLAV